MAAANLSSMPPRVLIVSRRCVRKNKFVDFVGEYHLDLLVKFGAVPVIVPRVTGIDRLLESFEPIHGVLLCEGEDIDPSLYESDTNFGELSPQDLEEIHHLHASDTAIDKEKDSIELRLAKLCLERNIPYLGICRGSQVLNVACGGTLYQDVEKVLAREVAEEHRVSHINYNNYDGHRHVVKVVENSPLHFWFKETLEAETKMEILVNSYHHQGVKRLAERFQPMAFAPDGLVEGFYDPNTYDPDQGNFIIGLQFHPERMRQLDSDEFDYPGCQHVYQEFVKAAIAYKNRISNNVVNVLKLQKLDQTWAKQRRGVIVKSLPLTKNVVDQSRKSHSNVGQDFLKSNTMRSQQEKTGLKVRATANIVGPYLDMLKLQEEREKMAKKIMEKLTIEQLSDLIGFYHTMGQACSDILEKKLNDVLNIELHSSDIVDLV